jgi:hypothetical protein
LLMGSVMQWSQLGNDGNVLSNQNTWYIFFDSFAC